MVLRNLLLQSRMSRLQPLITCRRIQCHQINFALLLLDKYVLNDLAAQPIDAVKLIVQGLQLGVLDSKDLAGRQSLDKDLILLSRYERTKCPEKAGRQEK